MMLACCLKEATPVPPSNDMLSVRSQQNFLTKSGKRITGDFSSLTPVYIAGVFVAFTKTIAVRSISGSWTLQLPHECKSVAPFC